MAEGGLVKFHAEAGFFNGGKMDADVVGGSTIKKVL